MPKPDRRRALISAAGLAVGSVATAAFLPEETLLRDRRPERSRVAIVSADLYSESLIDTLVKGLRLFRLSLSGKAVLLKPNLVEYIAGREVNTNSMLVTAAAEAFLRLGVPECSSCGRAGAPAGHLSCTRGERPGRSAARAEAHLCRPQSG